MTEIFDKLKKLQDILAEKYAIEREIEESPKKLSAQDELLARLKKEFIEKNTEYESVRTKIVQLKSELAEAEAARERGEKGMDAITAANKGMAIGSWKNAFNDGNLTNWRIPASATGTTGAKVATAAQKAIPALTKGSAVLSFAADAYGQWKEDSHNPSIGETEKVTRAAMKGEIGRAHV